MLNYLVDITGDLMVQIFFNDLFQIVPITFLFVGGLSILQLLKHSI